MFDSVTYIDVHIVCNFSYNIHIHIFDTVTYIDVHVVYIRRTFRQDLLEILK